ncbi:hypothetical protein PAXRUDRAFT_146881 [Paxillus rubicundulus Ve08.2h10]|uniref:Uncharacterized protein n=1 Tax=Paxillus rubicundulus Ve08.2h10 TaxID=930991 RepID=A0A0D0E5A3_9AGAM|nr:hypothetical protein PAXRUDRAFT_146881 [Paxillus rubicundulus Ve08.2h10]
MLRNLNLPPRGRAQIPVVATFIADAEQPVGASLVNASVKELRSGNSGTR